MSSTGTSQGTKPHPQPGVTVEARHDGAAIMAARQRVTRWVWLAADEIPAVIADLIAILPPDCARALLAETCARLADGAGQ